MKPILELKNIGKKYQIRSSQSGYSSLRESLSNFSIRKQNRDIFWALNDISFDVNAGETIGIIGRNGAGKSTLLKVLSRITKPSTGSILARGRVASLLEVGTGFHPELTGRENIYLNGSLLGMRKNEIDLKFSEIVEFSGVERFLETQLKHFSSGMQLRLAFAVAAFLEPEILIIDEVLAVGDAEFQKKCLSKMQDVSKSGRTILFVSHQMGAIRNLCERVIVLESGRVKFDGDTLAGIQQYLNRNSDSLSITPPNNTEVWMEEVSLNEGNQSSTIQYGDDLSIIVKCRAQKDLSAYFGFVIHSQDGIPILCANNRYSNTPIPVGNSGAKFKILLGKVPLMRGIYTISLYLGNEYKDLHIEENYLKLEVVERDIWGNGATPPPITNFWWPIRQEMIH